MSVHVLLLRPAEPGVFDEMPTRPFQCTILAHFPVTGSQAYVLVVSLSPEDEKANRESFGTFPKPALMVNGTRHLLEALPVTEDDRQAPTLAVSVADIGSG